MEVIVDDSQLSLAIGKKGQNVRLAAKLLGWKIDIKSEEEKRQEVESQMAALVSPGAPVSVLMEYGLAENIAEALVGAGIGAIDQLGSMTPEQLEEIQGIVPIRSSAFRKPSTRTTRSSMSSRPPSLRKKKPPQEEVAQRKPPNRSRSSSRSHGRGRRPPAEAEVAPEAEPAATEPGAKGNRRWRASLVR